MQQALLAPARTAEREDNRTEHSFEPQTRIDVTPLAAAQQSEAPQAAAQESEARSVQSDARVAAKQKGCAKVVQRYRPQNVWTRYISALGDARPVWQKIFLIFPGSLLLLVALVLSLFVEAGVRVVQAVRAIAKALFKILCCKCCSRRMRICCGIIFALTVLGGIAFLVLWLVCHDKGLAQCFSGSGER